VIVAVCAFALCSSRKHSSLMADHTSAYYQLVHLQRATCEGQGRRGGRSSRAGGSPAAAAEETEAIDASLGAPPAALAGGEAVEGRLRLHLPPRPRLAEEAAVGGGLPALPLPLPLSTNGPAPEAHPEAAVAAGTGGAGDVETGEAQKRVEVKRHGSFGGRAAMSLRRRLSSRKGRGKGEAWKEGLEEMEEEPGSLRAPTCPLARAPLNKPEWPLGVLATLAAMGNGLMFPVLAILLSRIIPCSTSPTPPCCAPTPTSGPSCLWCSRGPCSCSWCASKCCSASSAASSSRRVRRLCFSAVLRQEVGLVRPNPRTRGPCKDPRTLPLCCPALPTVLVGMAGKP